MLIDRLKEMLLEFLVITAGITICTTVFCTIFYNDGYFGLELLHQIVALGFFCTLPGIVFLSKKELTKKQMLIRYAIHMCILLALILFLAYRWEWIDPRNIVHPIIITFMFLGVYSLVSFVTYMREKKVAMELNEKLQNYKQKHMH